MLEAHESGTPVDHPLLDKVRECSTNPDAAADFFQRLLHPCHSSRLRVEALVHDYIVATFKEMKACKTAHLQTGNLRSFNQVLQKLFDHT